MPQLSVIVPTFNEAGNVHELLHLVDAALAGIDWELIFVDDDSPDGTANRLRDIAQQDPRVRCILRIDRRGLASACIEGMMTSSAPLLAVMDADLQHDEHRLADMVAVLDDPEVDVVVG
ncbi:MAG: glycosyltransferase, partial [Rubrivivax sp.]